MFFFSLKSGTGEARDSLGRYYSYYAEEEVQGILNEIGFEVTKRTNGKDKGLAGSIEKKLISWVRPGVLLVRASEGWEQRQLIALDLPAFDRPANATSAELSAGHSDKVDALVAN